MDHEPKSDPGLGWPDSTRFAGDCISTSRTPKRCNVAIRAAAGSRLYDLMIRDNRTNIDIDNNPASIDMYTSDLSRF